MDLSTLPIDIENIITNYKSQLDVVYYYKEEIRKAGQHYQKTLNDINATKYNIRVARLKLHKYIVDYNKFINNEC